MASKYDRIADHLRDRIAAGDPAPGDRLPAETALVAEYNVTLTTLRRALDRLEAEGLVERRQGIGNFVRAPRVPVRRTPDRYQWEKDRARLPEAERRTTGSAEHDTGLDVEDLHFSAEYATVPATPELAAALDVEPGTKLLERTYLTRPKGDDAPFNLARSYIPHALVKGHRPLLDSKREPWPGGTQHQLMVAGIEVDRIDDEITARPPSRAEVDQLALPAGVAVLALRKTSYDRDGRAVEVADVVMPGDRTTLVYSTTLDPWDA